jgi:Domain of unknown function (DUF4258)
MEDEPLDPSAATRLIRSLCGSSLDLRYTKHARSRMLERDLIVGDLLHVIKHGFVFEHGERSTRPGLFKYTMQCITPNSNGRTVKLVLIPSPNGSVKVVTVMWADESRQRGG